MIVKTLFHQNGRIETGQVEVRLLPGIPNLHIVGLPDASIRECGIKLKSALKACGLEWPAGMQIIVSLRPMDVRKGGAGVDLAIALAYLGVTDQLSEELRSSLRDKYVYGEVALNGDVFAPSDLSRVLRVVGDTPVVTGMPQREIREGSWLQISKLNQQHLESCKRTFDWQKFWTAPELPAIELHHLAARDLILSLHLQLSILLAGPQGSGKTTWARALHALTSEPDVGQMNELVELFGDECLETGWRPLEQPHHTITPQAMIGGGLPLVPGVISRAHGGVLIMDEFLEFHPAVLESLREPVESGYVELARKGSRERFPAEFQLVGTTNLCPCGKLNPNLKLGRGKCTFSLIKCRSVATRLSGPMLDRFDMFSLTHEWTGVGEVQSLEQVRDRLIKLRAFAEKRGSKYAPVPWGGELGLSHRRRKSIAKVARGLADMEESVNVQPQHFQQAFDLVVTPMLKLREVFA